jgi:MFS family permease
VTGPRPERVLEAPVLLASASFAFLNFSLPLRVAALDGGGLAVGALYATFTAVLLLARPLVGRALDRFGRRPFLIAAMAPYVVAMAGYAAAEGLAGLVVARVVQGAAAALLWVSVRTWIADVTAPEGRAEALGRVTERSVRGSVVGAGVAFALIGFLGMTAGWRLAFAGFGVCALAALVLVLRRVPASSPAPAMDAASDPPVRDPMLLAVVAAAATSVAVFPFVVLGLAETVGDDPARIAFWMLPVAAVMGFLPSRAGRLVDRHGARRVVPGALALSAAGAAGLAVLALGGPPPPALAVLALAAVIAGTAAAEPAFAARAGGREAATRGARYGRFELAMGLGGVLGPLAAGALHENAGPAAAYGFAVATALLALAVAAPLLARERGGDLRAGRRPPAG